MGGHGLPGLADGMHVVDYAERFGPVSRRLSACIAIPLPSVAPRPV